MATESAPQRIIKSWLGLGIGVFCTLLSLFSWLNTKDISYLVAIAGFVCWTIAWSQMGASFNLPLRDMFRQSVKLSRTSFICTIAGMVLVCASLAMRWLL
jgi:hypothetical protein